MKAKRDTSHQLDKIRAHFGWQHLSANPCFDAFMLTHLENKNYDLPETIAKIQRRINFENDELSQHAIEPSMVANLAGGAICEIGECCDQSIGMYVMTRRDFPTKKNRNDRKRNFDMMITYANRYPFQGITLLVNQSKAGIWANADMSFASSVALRISKFWPGVLRRVVLVQMGGGMTTLLKPIIAALPSHVGSVIQIMSNKELTEGRLFTLFPPSIVPVELGGLNKNDNEATWNAFADRVYTHYGVWCASRTPQSVKANACMARDECEAAAAALEVSPRQDGRTSTPFFDCLEPPSRNASFGNSNNITTQSLLAARPPPTFIDIPEEPYCRKNILECEEDIRGQFTHLFISQKKFHAAAVIQKKATVARAKVIDKKVGCGCGF